MRPHSSIATSSLLGRKDGSLHSNNLCDTSQQARSEITTDIFDQLRHNHCSLSERWITHRWVAENSLGTGVELCRVSNTLGDTSCLRHSSKRASWIETLHSTHKPFHHSSTGWLTPFPQDLQCAHQAIPSTDKPFPPSSAPWLTPFPPSSAPWLTPFPYFSAPWLTPFPHFSAPWLTPFLQDSQCAQ